MTAYIILWIYTLVLLVGFVAYWVRRTEHRHRERIAAIDAAAELDRIHFEVLKKKWDEEDRAARSEHETLMEQIRTSIPIRLDSNPETTHAEASAAT